MGDGRGNEKADAEDFAAMLAAFDGQGKAMRLQVGDPVRGKVFHISKENVFVSISAAQEGVIEKAEFVDTDGRQTVTVGDEVDAFVTSMEGGLTLSRKLGRHASGSLLLEAAMEQEIAVLGQVVAINKGGAEVMVAGTRGFCPMGQLDIDFVDEPQRFIGQTLSFLLKEMKDRGRTVVLSRRALLVREREASVAKLMATLKVGQRLRGKVSRVAAFGAFVDLGGVDGLLPIGELAHGRVARVEDVVSPGDTLDVEVLSIEPDPKKKGMRIGLSRRAMLDDPWDTHAKALSADTVLPGHVVRIEPFGAFVELFDGILGLIHISELSNKRVRHPGDVVRLDQSVTVRVLSADRNAKRVALSLREATDAKPADERDTVADFNAGQAQTSGLGTLGERLRKR